MKPNVENRFPPHPLQENFHHHFLDCLYIIFLQSKKTKSNSSLETKESKENSLMNAQHTHIHDYL